eukprot:Phypoly_transcript_01187.p1 GENE.Phypoly_transcript_01187~~Phypoly_transcript_01187.p1  ORF type:complete len:718 (+),score=105.98 Phypoly_transcript_01187:1437-3590(+)
MEAFKKLHSPQLNPIGFPQHLWEVLFNKIYNDIFDGGNVFEFGVEEEDGKYFVQVKEGVSVEAHSDVFLIDHAWTTTLATAKKQLRSIPGLLERMEGLMMLPVGEDDEENDGTEEAEENGEKAESEENEDAEDGTDPDKPLGTDLAARIADLSISSRSLSLEGLQLPQLQLSAEDYLRCKSIKHLDLQGNDFSDFAAMSQALLNFPSLESIMVDFPFAFMFYYIPSLQKINGFTRQDIEKRVEAVCANMWKYNQYYSMGTQSGEEEASVWYIMDELGSRIRHSDSPNLKIVPFFFAERAVSYSLAWPIQDIHGGDIATRDFLPSRSGTQKQLILDAVWGTVEEETQKTCEQAHDRLKKKLEVNKITHRKQVEEVLAHTNNNPTTITEARKFTVFTNMQVIRTSLSKSETFTITDNKATADILWIYDHFAAFSSITGSTQFVNQFPGEKCIVVKDLLLNTVTSVFGQPSWLPVTYNMETQLPEFLGDFFQFSRENPDKSRVFIVKPWNLARGIGHVITDNLSCMLRVSDIGPKVASLYLTNPALYDGKKFDLRYVIALKSVKPLELYVYKTFLVRFANKPFGLSDFDDYEKHLTVMTFVPYELKEVQHQDFITHYMTQKGGDTETSKSWSKIEAKIFHILRLAFAAASITEDGLVDFKNSRAIYGADVILDENDEPHLLEINFCPNCSRLVKYEPDFFEDIFQLLFCDKVNESRFLKL